MKRLFTNTFPAFILLLCFVLHSHVTAAQHSDIGIVPSKKYIWFGRDDESGIQVNANPVVQVPPACGKKRRSLGHDLPLPFGTAVSLAYFKQFYDATDLQLVNDSIGIVLTGEANIQQSSSQDIKLLFRPDIWVLPFLNVYGIIGYNRSNTIPSFEVPQITINDIPNVGDIVIEDTVTINDELISMGPVYGGGVNISSGYKGFFFVTGYRYTMTVPTDLDQRLETHSISLKAGILLGKKNRKVKGTFWLGGHFMEDTHKFIGEVNVKEILPEIGELPIVEVILGEKATYSGKLTPKQRWNVMVGGSVTINKHHLVAIELGYFKREQLSVFYGFRF